MRALSLPVTMARPKSNKPEPPQPSTRTRILDTARGLLVTGGPRAVTVQAIAALLALTPPALYKHFASRDAIIEALQSEARALFGAALAQAISARGTPLDRLRACGTAYVDFGLDQPQRYRLLFMSADDDFVRAAPRAEGASPTDGGGDGLALLESLVRGCQADGAIDPDADAAELSIGYWASCHGLVSLYLDAGGRARFSLRAFRALAQRCIGHLIDSRAMSKPARASSRAAPKPARTPARRRTRS